MIKLSTGQDSTLRNWLLLSVAFFGEESVQAKFFQEQVTGASKGLDEEVISDEGQLLLLLINMKEEA